jgi:Rrf2 family nitric oxide-sensitive transcriptional repressor
MISQTAEYALRAIVYLAMNPGEAFTAQQISLSTKVPAPYLSKVL